MWIRTETLAGNRDMLRAKRIQTRNAENPQTLPRALGRATTSRLPQVSEKAQKGKAAHGTDENQESRQKSQQTTVGRKDARAEYSLYGPVSQKWRYRICPIAGIWPSRYPSQ